MAEKATETAGFSELDTVALEIYKVAAANVNMRRGGEAAAREAFAKAEAFLAVRNKVKKGERLTQRENDGLADCCAPNLPRTHPLNVVARVATLRDKGAVLGPYKGDPARVQRIKEWLDRNPTPEGDPSDLVVRMAREFPELGWDLPTINVARAVFPAHCSN